MFDFDEWFNSDIDFSIREHLEVKEDIFFIKAGNLRWNGGGGEKWSHYKSPHDLILEMISGYGDVSGGGHKEDDCIVVSFNHHDCPVNPTWFRIYNGRKILEHNLRLEDEEHLFAIYKKIFDGNCYNSDELVDYMLGEEIYELEGLL